jgi:hypothetical protein
MQLKRTVSGQWTRVRLPVRFVRDTRQLIAICSEKLEQPAELLEMMERAESGLGLIPITQQEIAEILDVGGRKVRNFEEESAREAPGQIFRAA